MSDRSAQLIDRLGLQTPILQAPMAGVSTPQMAAAVTNTGGLGAIGIGAANVEVAQAMIAKTRAATDGPFNVNVFCHRPAVPSPEREAEWLARMAPLFDRFGAEPPRDLREIYTSFAADGAMQEMLCAQPPDVVSFHFGLPDQGVIERMKSLGIVLLATATSLPEARRIAESGIDGIVAQGWQAGGHRGVFDPDAQDERLATLDLVRQSVDELDVPVIAAGGIMTGADIAEALSAGAAAAQLGTAFIACPESSADAGYRAALLNGGGATEMTAVISGRPARCLANSFTAWGQEQSPLAVADYPIAYDAGKALNEAAKAAGEAGFGAQWAGQGATRARAMSAGELMQLLRRELAEAAA